MRTVAQFKLRQHTPPVTAYHAVQLTNAVATNWTATAQFLADSAADKQTDSP